MQISFVLVHSWQQNKNGCVLVIRGRTLSLLLFPNKWSGCHAGVRFICALCECCLTGPLRLHTEPCVWGELWGDHTLRLTLICLLLMLGDGKWLLRGFLELWEREIPILGSPLTHKSSTESAASLSSSKVFLQIGSAIFHPSCKLPVEDRFLT